jgi:hypothetical protein
MKSVILALALAVISAPAAAQTVYSFTAPDYVAVTDPCGTPGPDCFPYSTSMNISGSFTTASPLPAFQSPEVDITPLIIDYSFFDGVTTYSKGDPNSVIQGFRVRTDGNGNVNEADAIILQHWRSGSAPFAIGDTVDILNIRTDTDFYGPKNNLTCTDAEPDTLENRPVNYCNADTVGHQASQAILTDAGVWVTLASVPAVPALLPGALGLLACLFAGIGFRVIRRRGFSEA